MNENQTSLKGYSHKIYGLHQSLRTINLAMHSHEIATRSQVKTYYKI